MAEAALPPGYEDLAPFLESWALPSTAARAAKRSTSSMAEIQAFYDALAPRLEAALSHLDSIPYDDAMPPAARNLLALCLSLAEVTTAVEWYGQPLVIDGYDPAKIEMTAELP